MDLLVQMFREAHNDLAKQTKTQEAIVTSPSTSTRADATRRDPALRVAILTSAIVSVSYYLTAIIGFEFALQPGSVSTLWMPNSILLAGLLLTPRRSWWLMILAVLPAHFASELSSGVPTAMVLSWFVSNVAQALLAAFCICWFVKDRLRFDRFRDLTIFILLGAFLAPFLSSFLDAALVKLNGWGSSSYWYVWRLRFLSNVLATLTVVPVVILWVKGGLTALRNAPLRRYVEAGLLTVGLFVVSFIVFDSQALSEGTPSRLYLPLPFLLWATVRLGPRGTSTGVLLVMFLAIGGATRGTGPFVTSSSADNAVSIQWFLIVVSIPLMALAAVIEERRRAEALARQNEERLTLALNAAQMGTWDWQILDHTLTWTENTKRIFGLGDPNDALESFYRIVHPDDRLMVENAIDRSIQDGSPYEVEFRLLQDGNIRWVLSKGNVLYNESGRPARMLGVSIDLTERKRAEQALADINQQNQAILRAIPDMMFLQTNKGVYLDYYTRDVKMLLVPPENFLGKNLRDVLPKELADKTMECIGRLNGTDQPQMFEYDLLMEGELRHFEARLVSAGTDKCLSIVRDVTEARRAIRVAKRSEEQLIRGTRQIRALAARLLTAQESERRRISLLLHDDISQNIAAIGLSISKLKRKAPGSSEELTAELDRLGEQAHDLTTQIRRLSHQLHPEVLEHLGLVAALESHVTEFGHEEKIDMKFVSDVGNDPIPLDLSVCLYRVALEALRNVSRHAEARTATISLKENSGHLILEVSDSGKGFDVEKARRGSGIGLLSAEERIRLFQGTLDIRSNPQSGTVLVARVPWVRSV
jgi:PAS domain S-box-containing protein